MKKIIITAGGTSERIDNVRKIVNSSTGKLGMIIANTILDSINDVRIYYICSKNSIKPNDNRVRIVDVESVADLKNRVEFLLLNDKIDCFIHSMAVSDYTTDYITTIEKFKESIINCNEVEKIQGNKISSNMDNLVIVLKKTPKVISIIKDISPMTFLVGFKLLDGVSKDELISVASKLMEKNHCNMVVANDLSNIRSGNHLGYLISENGDIDTAYGKDDIAKKLVKKMKNFKISE